MMKQRFVPAQFLLTACTWLLMRWSRYLFLLFCSPILLSLLCVTFPLLCASEFYVRIRSGRRWRKAIAQQCREDEERLQGSKEGCRCNNEREERELGLLQWYLEDQLMLVGSVYDCGDVRDSDCGDDRDSDRRP